MFAPGQPREIKTPHGIDFNVWPGYAVEAKRGKLTLWFQLLNHVLADLPEPQRRWVKQWLAHAIKHPEVRPLTALVFYSITEGNGKSLIPTALGGVLGKAFGEITNKNIEDGFTTWAVGRTFLLLNETEASKYDRRKMMATIKNYITNQTTEINEKGRIPYTVKNYLRFALTTNQPDALTLSAGDRRFVIIHASEKRLPQRFYKAFMKWSSTPKGVGALRYWAEHVDLSGFDPGAPAPWTVAKDEMRQASLTQEDAWAEQLAAGEITYDPQGAKAARPPHGGGFAKPVLVGSAAHRHAGATLHGARSGGR